MTFAAAANSAGGASARVEYDRSAAAAPSTSLACSSERACSIAARAGAGSGPLACGAASLTLDMLTLHDLRCWDKKGGRAPCGTSHAAALYVGISADFGGCIESPPIQCAATGEDSRTSRYFSASMAARQPIPAAVTAWR